MRDDAFLARQPVLDKQNQIIGYELALRAQDNAAGAEGTDGQGAHELVSLLREAASPWPFQGKLVFIAAPESLLDLAALEGLPAHRLVLDIPAGVTDTSRVIERLSDLHAKGFKFCLEDFDPTKQRQGLLPFASFVKLDLSRHSTQGLERMTQAPKPHLARPIVTGVDSKEDFRNCVRLGLSLFQGYYFTLPLTLTKKVLNPTSLAILEAMRLAWDDADVSELENALQRDVTLSFKLLRYINSASVGAGQQVGSVGRAITLLGYKNFHYWLTLLLTTAGNNTSPPALAYTAVTRGALAEALGRRCFDDERARELFMMGMFSLLDVMFDMSKQALLEQLTLPQNVREALLERKGPDAPFLDLVEACETGDAGRLVALAAQLGLSAGAINQAHLAALARAEILCA